MKILLINPPGYLPTTFTYSLAAMKAELMGELDEEVKVLDLNAGYCYGEFSEFYTKLALASEDYFVLLEEMSNYVKRHFSEIAKRVINGERVNVVNQLVDQIIEEGADVVGISLTYNSQVFLTGRIIFELRKRKSGVKIVLGGPADYSKIMSEDVLSFASVEKMSEYLVGIGAGKKENFEAIGSGESNEANGIKGKKVLVVPDFSDFDKKYYFCHEIVYPIRLSKSCPYKQCTFCTHHGNANFEQFDLSSLKKTILFNGIKKICFIDDDITPLRLKQISSELKGMDVVWWCQMRPLKRVGLCLEEAYESGLRSVAWGLESGNQRVLDLIKKGTKLDDISDVLRKSSEIGIKNMLYVMFGFPTETKEEFLDTISFLDKHREFIDIVSPSVFGLQHGSKIMKKPSEFDVFDIEFEKRTLLGDKISYKCESGMSLIEVKKMMKENKHFFQRLNKVPRIVSVFKEQVLNC